MHRKELILRTGALVLSASLVMSSPLSVLADSGTDTVSTVSVSSGDTDNSIEEDFTDEVVPEESLPENDTPSDIIPDDDVSEKDLVLDDSKKEEKEVIDGDTKQKFTITILDHFADSVKTRETVTLEEGSEYSYSALDNVEGWEVTGDSSYNGVLTENMTLDFYYESVEVMPLADIREEPKVSVVLNFGGMNVDVDSSKIYFADYNVRDFFVTFDKTLISGITFDDLGCFPSKCSYDGKQWEVVSGIITKNGAIDSDKYFYTDLLAYGISLKSGDTLDIVINFSEISAPITVPVTVESDFGYMTNVLKGTYKDLKMYINHVGYNLSYASPTDVTFNNDANIRIVASDKVDIWTGTCTVSDGDVTFNKTSSEGFCGIKFDNSKVFLTNKDGSHGEGGGDGGGSEYFDYTYCDFKAETVDGKPIRGVSITDTSIDNFKDIFVDIGLDTRDYVFDYLAGGKEENVFNQVTDVTSFSYSIFDGVFNFIIQSFTDENGFTDMSVPLPSEYGDTGSTIPSKYAGVVSYDTTYEDTIFVGDGLIDFTSDTLTVDNSNISDQLNKYTPTSTHDILGSYYQLGYATGFVEKTVLLKDSFGNSIGTVLMKTVVVEANNPLDNEVTIGGNKYNCVYDEDTFKFVFVPEVSINMEPGVTDWAVSAEFDYTTSTFHIVATKTGKADLSVYDVYGASYEGGVLNTNNAVIIPRYENSYVEPNNSVSVSTKGITDFNSIKYKPLVSQDVEGNISGADSVNIDVEVNKSYSTYFYYMKMEDDSTPTPDLTPNPDPIEKVSIKVYDVYGDNPAELRVTDVLDKGTSYSYSAIEKGDYKVTSDSILSGVANDSMDLYFYYGVSSPQPSPDPTPTPTPTPDPSPSESDVAKRMVTVMGYLYYEDKTPIANKRIELHSEPRNTKTNDIGYYVIPNVEVGDYNLRIYDDNDEVLASCNVVVAPAAENDSVGVITQVSDSDIKTEVRPSENEIQVDVILPVSNKTTEPSGSDNNSDDSEPNRHPKPNKPEPSPVVPDKPSIVIVPEVPVLDSEPKTGETSTPWGIYTLLSMFGFVGTLLCKKKKQ